MAQTVFDSPTAVGAKILTVTATVTNTSGAYTNTIIDERITTAMKAIEIELGDPTVFGANITVICNNGSITISCPDVEGTSTVSIDVIKTVDDPTSVTSIEFDVLNSRINKVKEIINDVAEYSDESTYSAGDRVWYSGRLYKANQAISTAEEWTAAHWDQEDVVEKVDELDDSVNALQDAIAIVAVGNTHGAVTTGQFVYVKTHDTLAEGLYKASSDIAANATLSSSNLTADSSGGLNDLKSQIPPVVNNLTSDSTTSALSAAQGKALDGKPTVTPTVVSNIDLNTITTTGTYILNGNITNSPYGNYGYLTVIVNGTNNDLVQYYTNSNSCDTYVRRCYTGTWSNWEMLALNSSITIDYRASGDALTIAESVAVGRNKIFYCTGSVTNKPIAASGGYMFVSRYTESQYVYLKALFYNAADSRMFVNTKWSSGWLGWQEILTDKRVIYRQVPANGSITIDVQNPCFIFTSEDDTHYLAAYCSGTTVNTISGSLLNNTVSKTDSAHLKVTNARAWGTKLWVLNNE